MQLHLDDSSTDTRHESFEGNSPHNQFRLSSYLDLPRNFELDTSLYYVDELPALDIPDYWRFDVRLG